MENNGYDIDRELKQLKSDRLSNEIELSRQQNKLAELLRGEMGKDIQDVINGRKVVKLSFYEKLRYKVNHIIDSFFKLF